LTRCRFMLISACVLLLFPAVACQSHGSGQLVPRQLELVGPSATVVGGTNGIDTRQMWMGKGGDGSRAGRSSIYSGPRSLSNLAWKRPCSSGNCYESPAVDAEGGVYNARGDGILDKISAKGDVLWQIKLAPKGLSTPALMMDANGRLIVYVTPLAPNRLFALDAATGSTILNVTYGSPDASQGDGWSVGAAAGVVMVCGAAPDRVDDDAKGAVSVYAINATTGAPLWSFSQFVTTGQHGRPYNFMPVLVPDDTAGPTVLYETDYGAVFKHHLLTGAVIWNVIAPSEVTMTTAGCAMTGEDPRRRVLICVSNYDGEKYAVPTKGLVRALDVSDGSLLWQTRTDLQGEAGPAIADGRIYLGLLGFGQATAGATYGNMTALNASTGALLWQTRTHDNPLLKPASCAPDTFNNAAVGMDGTVYFGWWGGYVYAVEGRTGKVLDWYETKSGIQGAPAISDGVVYFPTCDHLYAFTT